MGLGFNSNNVNRDIAPVYPHVGTSQSTDIWKILKGIGGIIATLALLGGLVWGSATLFAGTASDDDLDTLRSRVELVEKNDIKQTLILEYIKETLDEVEEKLDRVLEK